MTKYSPAEKACIAISRETDAAKRKIMFEHYESERYEEVIDTSGREEVENFTRNLDEQGIVAVTIKSADYPHRLLNLNMPPLVLYCRGNLNLFRRPAAAIVGTRDCTRYGMNVATSFARELAQKGIVIVSGLADGIDTAAHNGAFEVIKPRYATHTKGKSDTKKAVGVGSGAGIPGSATHTLETTMVNTIAVLGNGINYYYPKANKVLQDRIAEQGLLVSEYLPNSESTKYNFPYRNRIVAALSNAVVIVEADIKSGTMITRDWAIDLGVEVFAVPGPITGYASRGTNQIIKEAACTMATSVDDVLEAFNVFERNSGGNAGVTGETGGVVEYRQISFEEKAVMDALGAEEIHFDDIMMGTNFSVKSLSTLLTNMEMDGLIKKLAGNFYVRG